MIPGLGPATGIDFYELAAPARNTENGAPKWALTL
jgi:hypothetical protein